MTRREIYEGVVAEVEADFNLIQVTTPISYDEVVTNTAHISMALNPEGVTLKSPTSAFAQYAVRDNLMLKAVEDEKFAMILTCKVGKHVEDKVNTDSRSITQADIEALAMAGQITAMWEQFDHAEYFLGLISRYTDENNLEIPTLATVTLSLINSKDKFNFALARADMPKEIGSALDEELDK